MLKSHYMSYNYQLSIINRKFKDIIFSKDGIFCSTELIMFQVIFNTSNLIFSMISQKTFLK